MVCTVSFFFFFLLFVFIVAWHNRCLVFNSDFGKTKETLMDLQCLFNFRHACSVTLKIVSRSNLACRTFALLFSCLTTAECRVTVAAEAVSLEEMTCTQRFASWYSEIICWPWGWVDHFLYCYARWEILVHVGVCVKTPGNPSPPLRSVCILFFLK